nr:bifunctional 2',3'-cyclic-nucleotide 2'-phosphodiesterase/3'-nucleotidase [Ectobacillus ponti]
MLGTAIALGVTVPQLVPAMATAEGTAAADPVVQLRILETSDIHENLMNYDYYQTKVDEKVGLVKTATLIQAARGEVKNSVLFDDGDALQGNPLGDYMAKIKGIQTGETHPLYRLMNLLQYDAISLGNHEFNYGLDFLAKSLETAKFPVINSNVYKDDGDNNDANDQNYFKPYEIIDKQVEDQNGQKHSLKVGVLGFVPPQVMNWDKANLEGKVKAKDIIETANKLVPEMKAKGADVIVALAHSGVDERGYLLGMENASFYLTQVQGIDAVLTGHSHAVIAKNYNGVPVVMPGAFGSNLGIIDMELKQENGKWVVNQQASVPSVRPIPTTAVQLDPTLVDAVKPEHEGTIAYVNQPVGKTTAPINSYFALVKDDPSIQIVTNAQKWYTEQKMKGTKYEGLPVLSAGAPFKAGGRNGVDYYTDIPAGTLAIKNVADLYVFPNTLYAVKINGAQLKDWLEMSAGQFNQIDPAKTEEQALINTVFPTYNYDVLDGVQYQIDVTQPARFDKDGKVVNEGANRIVNLTYQGKPVADTQEFVVATNNYRGSNPSFPGVGKGEIILRAPDENRQIIVEYIRNVGTVNPSADGNWSFKPIDSKTLNVTFESSPNAQKYLTDESDIKYVGASDVNTGFARYSLKFEAPSTPAPGDDTPDPGTETPAPDKGTPAPGTGTTAPGSQTGAGGNQGTTPATNTGGSNTTGELPDTATNIFTMLAAGLAAVGAGIAGLYRRKKA